MEKQVVHPESLHILYTGNIQGDLMLLPRLQTFLRHLKALPLDEPDEVLLCMVQPVPHRTLLLDLGGACSPQAWHCAATQGRSTLIALDAMGYHVAHVEGALTADSRARLADNLMGMALVDHAHPWQEQGVRVVNEPSPNNGQPRPTLTILMKPAGTTHLQAGVLSLAAVQAGQVGAVHMGGMNSSPIIYSHAIFDLPSATPPDATIAGTVDFILSEARLYSRKNS